MPDHHWLTPAAPRVFAAAVTGAAVTVMVTPLAYAATADHATPRSSSAEPTPGDGRAAVTPQETAPAPDFGYQKVRVGVQVADGSWVPPGTTTAGSDVSVVETGPGAEAAAAFNGLIDGKCTTDASTNEAGSTATYCTFAGQRGSRPAARRTARDDVPSDQQYTAFPGDTVTLTQQTVEPNLRIDPVAQTVQPCTVAQSGDNLCEGITTVMFNDPGLPPHAVDDNAGTINSGASKNINVINNDTKYGNDPEIMAPYSIVLDTAPKHGDAVAVVPQQPAGRRAHAGPVTSGTTFHYASDAGYVGKDSFTYTLTTPNGSSTATVRIAMVAQPSPSPKPTPTRTPHHHHHHHAREHVKAVSTTLPNTGGPQEQLLYAGLALLGAGLALSTAGRVRRTRSDRP